MPAIRNLFSELPGDFIPGEIILERKSDMLIEQIRADWIAARKARDVPVKATVLGTLIGSIQSKEKTFSPERSLTDEEVVAQIKKMLDGVHETRGHIEGRLDHPKREEVLASTQAEIDALSVYMPKQLSETAIEEFLRAKIAEGIEPTIKDLMGVLRKVYSGAYDGKMASQIIKRIISV